MTVIKREPVAATEISELTEVGPPELAAYSADCARPGDGQTDAAAGSGRSDDAEGGKMAMAS
jgi:hypothetical protein